MNKGLKALIWVVVLILIVWGISAISGKGNGNQPPATGSGPIKVGVMVPLTGDAAVYGETARNIYQLAVEEINKAGGVNGNNLELIIEDSKCTGEAGAAAAQKLINADKVQVIIGGFCSGESLSAVPIATAGKVTLFSPGSSNPGLTNISSYFFRDYPSDASQGKILADVAYNDKGYRNVAFVQEQTDYATGVYQAFNDEFKKLGGNVTNESFPTPTTDFRSILSKVKTSNPDAVMIDTQTPAVAARIMTQAQQLQYKPALMVSDAVSGDPDTIAKNAAFLEGSLTAEFGTDPSNPKFQHLIETYKAKYGKEPNYQGYAQTEYDAVFIVRDALLAVGNNGQKIAEWSRTIKDWAGASGNITILSSGDRDGGHVVRIIKGGKLMPYTK